MKTIDGTRVYEEDGQINKEEDEEITCTNLLSVSDR